MKNFNPPKAMKWICFFLLPVLSGWLAAQTPPPAPPAPPARPATNASAATPSGAKLSTNLSVAAPAAALTNRPGPPVPLPPSLPARLAALTNAGNTNLAAALAALTNRTPPAPMPPPLPAPPAPSTGTSGPAAAPAGGTTTSAAGGTNAPAEDIIPAGVIKFQAADLTAVLEVYAELVHRTILRPASLPDAKITLKTQTPLTTSEAIRALEAVLAMNQITLINVGEKFVKVVPQAQAFTEAKSPSDSAEVTAMPELSGFVTVIRQLTNAKPSEVVQAIQPFAKMQGGVVPIDSSGILVMRDYADNIKRMQEMLDKIDVSLPLEVEPVVIHIKYALAGDIAQVLGQLTSGGSVSATGSSGGSRSLSSRGSMSSRTTSTTGGYPGQPGYNPANPLGATTGVRPTTTPGSAQSTFADRLKSIVSSATGKGDFEILGQTKIIADERLNALLVFADKHDMQMITNIINKLDVVLAQVLIEALVVEVLLNDNEDYGISYLQRAYNKGAWTGAGSVFTGSFDDPGGITGVSSNLASGFSYLMRWGKFDVAMKAAASDGRISVLSRPRVQTSHAREAHLFVGETRPYPSSYGYGGGFYSGYSSIQQLQIGIQLDVLPLINPDGLVVLEIQQRIQNVGDTVNIQNVGDVPTTVDREANATVAVRDGETIVLGGFISADHSKTKSGVPFLKDIPGLGALFRSSSEKRNRKELMVFIRPTVLPTPEAASRYASDERNRVAPIYQAESEFEMDERKRASDLEKDLQAEKLKKSGAKSKSGTAPAKKPAAATPATPPN